MNILSTLNKSASSEITNSEPVNFETVLREELDQVGEGRDLRRRRFDGNPPPRPPEKAGERSEETTEAGDVYREAFETNLAGLAFSGGGIRSATFNLGVLQALAEKGLLRKIDYLSTVSGGGYIGSWLAAWIERATLRTVEENLSGRGLTRQEEFEGPHPIKFLRQYSNYLTPRLGVMGADTWTFIATYLRNLTLNLLILTPALVFFLMVPRLLLWLYDRVARSASFETLMWPWLLLGLAITAVLMNLSTLLESDQAPKDYAAYGPWRVQVAVIFPALAAAWIGSAWLWTARTTPWRDWHVWSVVSGCGYALLWALAFGVGEWIKRESRANTRSAKAADAQSPPYSPAVQAVSRALSKTAEVVRGASRRAKDVAVEAASTLSLWGVVFSALAAGIVAGPLFLMVARCLGNWDRAVPGAEWLAASFGMPLVLLVFLSIAVAHIGLVGTGFTEEAREWWSRLVAWLLIYLVAWFGILGLAIYSPLLILAVPRWAGHGLTLGWVVSTLAGILAGRSAATGKPQGRTALELVAKLAPFVFVAGLLAALATIQAFAIQQALPFLTDSSSTTNIFWDQGVTLRVIGQWLLLFTGATLDLAHLLLWATLFILVALFLSSRVDINEFSMHNLYRYRLVRSYLGASNPFRRPQPFTGIDPNDDVLLASLLPGHAGHPYEGPYPIINATLNLVHGEELAWQERKAASFTFTPRFCGYEVPKKYSRLQTRGTPKKVWYKGYRPTEGYAHRTGVFLGKAMAISGAAASPNMGFHTSRPLAFLMTIFNVRLGWWLGNPRRDGTWKDRGPKLGLTYLLSELLGLTNDRARYVYLSDGGHFENLGLYELVRRRCRFIIACDASQDQSLSFEDLGNAIRKCRTDLGVEIEIDLGAIHAEGAEKWCLRQFALGTVRYPRLGAESEEQLGALLYIKAALTGKEPADVLSYASRHPQFPHQSTADQWFDESQFESYRKLGYFAALAALNALPFPPHLGGAPSTHWANFQKVFG